MRGSKGRLSPDGSLEETLAVLGVIGGDHLERRGGEERVERRGRRGERKGRGRQGERGRRGEDAADGETP